MRSFLKAAAAVLTLGLLAAPAHASTWECKGPAPSCVSSPSSLTGTHRVNATVVHKSKHYATHTVRSVKHIAVNRGSSGGSYSGMASYYWEPQALASGGRFNPNAMTAAHKTLPFGTKVLVTNRNNGRSVVVTINDRGPYVAGRVIDLSRAAASAVGMTGSGVAPVSVSVIGRG